MNARLNSFGSLWSLQIKDQATSGFQAFIVHYRDDPDQQNLIDWIQERWVSYVLMTRRTVTVSLVLHYLEMIGLNPCQFFS